MKMALEPSMPTNLILVATTIAEIVAMEFQHFGPKLQ